MDFVHYLSPFDRVGVKRGEASENTAHHQHPRPRPPLRRRPGFPPHWRVGESASGAGRRALKPRRAPRHAARHRQTAGTLHVAQREAAEQCGAAGRQAQASDGMPRRK
eukprot:scaffold3906_cov120-Isochrysis_galbana.AAC.11